MPVTRELEAFVVEQLSAAGEVVSRRMFGGVGLYLEGEFVGIIGPDSRALFLRVDDHNRERYERAGMEVFRPYRSRPETTMSYYQVPADVVEDAEALASWALESLEVARRAGRPGRAGRRRSGGEGPSRGRRSGRSGAGRRR